MLTKLLISMFIGFLFTFIFVPIWIRRALKAGLVGVDVNKFTRPKVAEVGGITTLIGFLAAIMIFISIETFLFENGENTLQILALVSSILIVSIIGFTDDILGWRIGIRQRYKPILTFFAAVPLMAINAGFSTINIPFFGTINIGLLYPLIIIPLVIVFISNAFNMLAGYNGLETGQGIIILSTLGVITLGLGKEWLAIIVFSMAASLLAFFLYNKYPSKIFPGNTLTYSVGALIAGVAIIGNIEKIVLILLIPYILEFLLKARGGMKKESFAKPNSDGSLDLLYNKIYGLEHTSIILLKKIKRKVYEKDIVYALWAFQLIFCLIALIYFFL